MAHSSLYYQPYSSSRTELFLYCLLLRVTRMARSRPCYLNVSRLTERPSLSPADRFQVDKLDHLPLVRQLSLREQKVHLRNWVLANSQWAGRDSRFCHIYVQIYADVTLTLCGGGGSGFPMFQGKQKRELHIRGLQEGSS